jgi:DGQHR domain-containing protein
VPRSNNKGEAGSILELTVISGVVLGVPVYRGFARLCDLAQISEADIYDRENNPLGTQRDLSPKHAREAYEYVANRDLAFWPEVFLCARLKNAISFAPNDARKEIGTLSIHRHVIERAKTIAISRVDGNHRLQYADGRTDGYPPIDKTVSFCVAYGITRDQEITLFKDINDNQMKMNTSHLENIEARLTKEEKLKFEDAPLFIAKRLGEDSESPLAGRVYLGGRKSPGWSVPLSTLKSGIKYMFSRFRDPRN